MANAIRNHWPEYLMEAGGLGIFMMLAGVFAIALYHPQSPLVSALADPLVRRLSMGCAMGLTAIGLIYSPWGKRSGAHFNPAVTLTFLRLGKIGGGDALFYVVAQLLGGLAGVLLLAFVSHGLVADPSVNYMVTVPGAAGSLAAFLAETAMSLGLMFVVLTVSSAPRLAPWTGLCAGILVATFIALEAPISASPRRCRRTSGPRSGST